MTRLITLDFETYYDKEFSLSKMTTESYIRDPRFEVIGVGVKIDDGKPSWYSGDKAGTQAFLDSLDIPNSNLVCHNMAFDGAILSWIFGIKPKYYFDTLSMARPITGQSVGGSLAALAKKFQLGVKGTEVVNALGKRRLDFGFTDLDAYAGYCMNDVELTYKLFHILRQQSTPKEMYIIDLMIRMYTDPVIELDEPTLVEHLNFVQDKKQKLMDRIDEQIGREALMSNPQFAEVLRKLGVEPPMKVSLRTGKETYAFGKTDTQFKELLNHESDSVQAVVAARLGIKSTLEETRTQAFIGISKRGALPILLNYYGAHTGRASGGDKINLQNLPRGGRLRKSIRSPQGHTLVASDSAQIEARVVAWLAGEKDLVKDFASNVDIYSKFASEVYGYPVKKETHPTERFVGKTCILGLGYGMGHKKFRATLKIGQGGMSVDFEEPQAERVVRLYRDTYPMITKLWKEGDAALAAMADGYEYDLGTGIQLRCTSDGIVLPNGMKMRYANLRVASDGFEYDSRYGAVKIYGGKVIENVVQALARIVVFDQMAKIDQELRKLDSPDRRYKVVLTVHDEVVVVCPEEAEKDIKNLVFKIMSTPPSWAPDLPIACEANSGMTYADCK